MRFDVDTDDVKSAPSYSATPKHRLEIPPSASPAAPAYPKGPRHALVPPLDPQERTRTQKAVLSAVTLLLVAGVSIAAVVFCKPHLDQTSQPTVPASYYELADNDFSYNDHDCREVYMNKDWVYLWRCVRRTIDLGTLLDTPTLGLPPVVKPEQSGLEGITLSSTSAVQQFSNNYTLSPVDDHPEWFLLGMVPVGAEQNTAVGVFSSSPANFPVEVLQQFAASPKISFQRIQKDGQILVGAVWDDSKAWSTMDLHKDLIPTEPTKVKK